MLDYLKCVVANPLVLVGYLCSAGAVALFFPLRAQAQADRPEFAVLWSFLLLSYGGTILLFATVFGAHTLDSYRQARSLLAERGEIRGYIASLHASYCRRRGAFLAEMEYGLRKRP
jgi:hypothetical protein